MKNNVISIPTVSANLADSHCRKRCDNVRALAKTEDGSFLEPWGYIWANRVY